VTVFKTRAESGFIRMAASMRERPARRFHPRNNYHVGPHQLGEDRGGDLQMLDRIEAKGWRPRLTAAMI
jgi:hypothetical protein